MYGLAVAVLCLRAALLADHRGDGDGDAWRRVLAVVIMAGELRGWLRRSAEVRCDAALL